jgi:pyocin large subunit-like protein
VVAVAAIGFVDDGSRADHFKKHAGDFGAVSEDEYEKMAVAFLNGPVLTFILECIRKGNGDKIRFSLVSNSFGVMRKDGVIKTYFVADMKVHGRRTNLDYFYEECAK